MKARAFFSELNRRNVYKVAVVYAIVTWLLIQLASISFFAFQAPPWGRSALSEVARRREMIDRDFAVTILDFNSFSQGKNKSGRAMRTPRDSHIFAVVSAFTHNLVNPAKAT